MASTTTTLSRRRKHHTSVRVISCSTSNDRFLRHGRTPPLLCKLSRLPYLPKITLVRLLVRLARGFGSPTNRPPPAARPPNERQFSRNAHGEREETVQRRGPVCVAPQGRGLVPPCRFLFFILRMLAHGAQIVL